jgi:quercetin dioxygenase-like cupin family protein
MIKRESTLVGVVRSELRGGQGKALFHDYLAANEMAGVQSMSVLTLEPGATIGEHQHTETEELYYILAGTGTGYLDGASFTVGPGDAWVVHTGHSHALVTAKDGPLRLLALQTRV